MPYLIAIPSSCGSDFCMRVSNRKGIKDKVATMMKHPDIKEVYYITEYTQKMCEMEPREFDDYVRRNGVKLT